MDEPKAAGIPLSDELREEMRQKVTGMSYGRYKEILALDRSGRLDEVNTDEQAEYREFDKSVQETRRIFSSIQGPRIPKANRPGLSTFAEPFELANPNEGMERRLEEAIAEMAEQKHFAAKSVQHLELMSKALDEMKADRRSADERTALQATTNAAQAKLNRVFTIVALVLAFASVVVPFIIESIKGWQ